MIRKPLVPAAAPSAASPAGAPTQPPAGVEPVAGDVVTVTLGAQKFAPVQYHSIDVGPFSMTTTVGVGESIADVNARCLPQLQALVDAAFAAELPKFIERVRTAAQAARSAQR